MTTARDDQVRRELNMNAGNPDVTFWSYTTYRLPTRLRPPGQRASRRTGGRNVPRCAANRKARGASGSPAVRSGRIRTRRRRGSGWRGRSRWRAALPPKVPARPGAPLSEFPRSGFALAWLPWVTSICGCRVGLPRPPRGHECRARGHELSGQRPIAGDVPDRRPARSRAERRLTPLQDSAPAVAMIRSGPMLSLGFVPCCVWSSPWPPAPIGRVFCVCRS